MNLLFFLPSLFPFLDVAIGPSFSGNMDPSNIDPVTKAIVIVVLALFLAFVGYLIWKSLRKNDN